MPAMLDDPTAPVIYRTSGDPPYPTPNAPPPPDIFPRQVTLRDRSTTATLIPFSSPDLVPQKLIAYLCAQLNKEIEKGDTYPMINQMPLETFGPYWFANFGAVMFLGEVQDIDQLWRMEKEGADWTKLCLGSFYVKPNYPGRSSHVCNGGFLVTDAARNRGVGRLMGEGYLEWAPRLGYTYSIFNLVYETNVASLRIWDALGFKRVGRVKGAGNLKSFPDRLIDAIVFGRDLSVEPEDFITEERFEKIRFYLKTNQYPAGADRAEKSRLRSASAHYRVIPPTATEDEKLMLKDKEVISDPTKQYEIAHRVHSQSHAGINKTTATIADKYHWIRIKETVSSAIRNCSECKDAAARQIRTEKTHRATPRDDDSGANTTTQNNDNTIGAQGSSSAVTQASQHHMQQLNEPKPNIHTNQAEQHPIPVADMNSYHHNYAMPLPVDPQIMQGMQHEHGGPHDINHYAAQNQYQDYSGMDGGDYDMHGAQSSGAGGHFGEHDVGAASLQAQLRRDMAAQYRQQQGGQ